MGMLFGEYDAQGVKIKRVKGVYVMTRKRIAVLTAQADEYTQGRFLSGFFEKAFQLDYDVCVFSMYLKYQDTASREVGDANIFNLIEFDKYDAVVICTDRIRTPGTDDIYDKSPNQCTLSDSSHSCYKYTRLCLFGKPIRKKL